MTFIQNYCCITLKASLHIIKNERFVTKWNVKLFFQDAYRLSETGLLSVWKSLTYRDFTTDLRHVHSIKVPICLWYRNVSVPYPNVALAGVLCFVTAVACKWTRNSAVADKPRNAFRGQSRSPNIVPFGMLGMVVSYSVLY